MTSKLFTPIRLRAAEIPNRIVVSSMCQYDAIDGNAHDWHLMHLGQFAMGAAGLVMTEATHVSPEGRISPKCLGLYSDDNERNLKRVVDFCRRYGVTKLGVQLAHAGRKASVHPPQDGAHPLTAEEGAWQTVGPSAEPYAPDWHVPKALDEEGLAKVEADFVHAAERAMRIGFDLVELHMAHGYLMHEFISPLSNRRNDAYGGPLPNRMRFPLRVFDAVRAALPEETPLGVRVSATDWVPGGLTVDETVEVAKALKERGCDFVDVSSGGNDRRQTIELGPGYQVPFATRVRREAEIPVWAVGMISDPHQAEAIIRDGEADMVALARGMMFDPRWAWHAAEALGAETAYAGKYMRAHPSNWPQAFPNRRDAAD
jgi:2,4-dienoyl-CoA reductase-like NADH-dependent reductase (Old Yellow Enzyme family)